MWAARDKDGSLNLFFRRVPKKQEDHWDNFDDWCQCAPCDDIPSIKWEDDKPTKVDWKGSKLVICK